MVDNLLEKIILASKKMSTSFLNFDFRISSWSICHQMIIIYNIQQLEKPLKNAVLTIGNFDGVHRGHMALLNKVKEITKSNNGHSAVMTFDPHPIKVMRPGNGPPLITPIRQKLDLIQGAGIETIFCLAFTKGFAEMSAEAFVQDILVNKIGISDLVVGYDYTFGHDRKGNIKLLQEMEKALDFKVHVVSQVLVDGIPVSSSLIRELVLEGKLDEAKKLLGRNYQVYGTVVTGKNRGARLLGYPTANLKLVDELIPKLGVYAVTVLVDNQVYNGVANIGYNPTFGNGAFSVETHILDFSGNLIGKPIRINFIQRLRDERAFANVDELAGQIGQDIAQAKELLKKLLDNHI